MVTEQDRPVGILTKIDVLDFIAQEILTISEKVSMKFETACIHAGQSPDPSTGAVMTPIHRSQYVQDGVGKTRGYEYSRTGNPTWAALEACLAELEGRRVGWHSGAGGCYGCGSTAAVAGGSLKQGTMSMEAPTGCSSGSCVLMAWIFHM